MICLRCSDTGRSRVTEGKYFIEYNDHIRRKYP